ncbi:filamentous hemagglutinin N-terminal domain-containing protein [Azospirillum sp. A1-3]|uniref:two-partner secretion domain-containing protein n=1 Tax=Azospirillum sp. A1-3 TaxID=185874 RepID=UPI0020773D5F|nr:filamentous hemagglutinin N-terminal domain-containing protein [Azospirillum sp. A1-3]MCM8738892.1 filamentous hemagglutinin N-terminal domain-containing protein [Azospirillum sp. A1-3]
MARRRACRPAAPIYVNALRLRLRGRAGLASTTALNGSLALFLAVVTMAAPDKARANPQGGSVVQGQASIAQTAPNRVDITQTSNKAIIEWQSFGIGASEHTHFQQPDRNAVALNRVVGANPSDILGRLTANGQVWLVNPNGIFFGHTATIDVSGLVATTHDIRNDDFMAGRYRFEATGAPPATVVNEGKITVAEAGLAGLVAPAVANRGVITARLGEVSLASGMAFTVDLFGDQKINLALDRKVAEQVRGRDGKPVQALVENKGAIYADGGRVYMSAAAAKGVVDKVIDMSGIVQARSVEERDGEIVLLGDEGTVQVSGTLDASGRATGTKGGTVTVTGKAVALAAGAKVDVSGRKGGGEALIGGDYLGGRAEARRLAGLNVRPARKPVPPAMVTTVDKDATVVADATDSGKGGKIVVWADDATRSHGALSARGGPQGGDGGFIETSGLRFLDVTRAADASAPKGQAGLWLLDPTDITIETQTEDDPAAVLTSTTLSQSRIDPRVIESSLNSGTDVTVVTDAMGNEPGNITVNSAIRKTDGGDATLSLQAHNDITVNANISSTSGKLNMVLTGDQDASGRGGVIVRGGGLISNGGDITVSSGARYSTYAGIELSDASLTSAGGAISLTGIGSDATVVLGGSSVDAGGGAITLSGQWVSLRNGTKLTSAGGPISLTGTSAFVYGDNSSVDLYNSSVDAGGGAITLSGQDVSLRDGTKLTSAGGPISLTGTGASVYLDNSSVDAESGAITLSGQRVSLYDGTKLTSAGGPISLSGQDVSLSGASLTSAGGPISLTGTDASVHLYDSSVDAGAGAIALSGQRVSLSGSSLTSAGGAISLTGFAGADTVAAVEMDSSSVDAGRGALHITAFELSTDDSLRINADSVDLTVDRLRMTSQTGSITGTGTVTIRPLNSDIPINLGAGADDCDCVATELTLTQGDLNRFSGYSALIVGGHSGGSVRVGALELPFNTTIRGADITFNGAVTGTGRNMTLDAGTSDIAFNETVGSAAGPLGAIVVESAHDVTGKKQVWANSFTQVAGTGTTNFEEELITGASGSVQVATDNLFGKYQTGTLTFNTRGTTVTGNESVSLENNSRSGQHTFNGVTVPFPYKGTFAQLKPSEPDTSTPTPVVETPPSPPTTPVVETPPSPPTTPVVETPPSPPPTPVVETPLLPPPTPPSPVVPPKAAVSPVVEAAQREVDAVGRTRGVPAITVASNDPLSGLNLNALPSRFNDLSGSTTGSSLGSGSSFGSGSGGIDPFAGMTRPAFVTSAELSLTGAVRDGIQLVNDALRNGSLNEAVIALATSGQLSNAELRAVFDNVPVDALVAGLKNSQDPTVGQVGDLLEKTTGGENVKYVQIKQVLERANTNPDVERAYLSLYQRVQKDARTDLFAQALEQLRRDPGAADLFTSDGPDGPQFADLRFVRFTPSGAAVIEGRIINQSRFVHLRVGQYWTFVDEKGQFQADIPVSEGRNNILLSALDEDGKKSERTITVDAPRGTTADSQPRAGRKIAVLIANAQYQDQELPELDTPKADVQVVATSLSRLLGYETRIVTNADKKKIVETLSALGRELTDADQVVVYYAGHGYAFPDSGLGYWLPVDAGAHSPNNWLSNKDVSRLLSRMPAKHIMLVADSCYSGSFTKDGSISAADIQRDQLRDRRAVMAMSSGGDEPVMDGDVNSPFASAFISQVRRIAKEEGGFDLFLEVRKDVTKTTPQTPHYGVVSFAGYDPGADYLFERGTVTAR